MIPEKVIESILFGAGCFLGVRNCAIKIIRDPLFAADLKNPKFNAPLHLKELIGTVKDLFSSNGLFFDFALAIELSNSADEHHAIQQFVDDVKKIYVDNAEDFKAIWIHFSGKEVNFETYQGIEGNPVVWRLLKVCIECMQCFERLSKQDQYSIACVDYFNGPINQKEIFAKLIGPIVKLRLRDSPVATPKGFGVSFVFSDAPPPTSTST